MYGFGNLFQSFVSAFVVALLSGRVFLVDCEPLTHFFGDGPQLSWDYAMVAAAWGTDYIQANAMSIDLTNHNYPLFQDVLCGDLNQMYAAQFVFVHSDQYFAPLVLLNPHYAARVASWERERLFGTIHNFLVRPSAAVLAEVEAFKAAHFDGKFVVGVQVRTATMGMDTPVMGWTDLEWAHFHESYWKCARLAARQSKRRNGREIVYFLATDNVALRQIAEGKLRSVVHTNNMIERGRLEGYSAALVDLWLLAAADELIVTTHSTYGLVAAAMASKVPYLLTFHGQCTVEITSQPCFHVWSYVYTHPHIAKCYDPDTMTAAETRYCGPPTAPVVLEPF